VSNCLRDEGVFPYDTRDEEGRERFLPFTAGHHFTYKPPQKNPTSDWYVKYSMGLKLGNECCSPEAGTYHYIKPKLMYRYDALLYDMCDL